MDSVENNKKGSILNYFKRKRSTSPSRIDSDLSPQINLNVKYSHIKDNAVSLLFI